MKAQATPNPNALKFVFDSIHWHDQHSFRTAEAAGRDPMAQALFALPGVRNVFWTRDFVTVNKEPDVSWERLQPAVEKVLRTYLERET